MLNTSGSPGCCRKELLCPPLTAVVLAVLCLGSGCATPRTPAEYLSWSQATCELPKNGIRIIPGHPAPVAETGELPAGTSGLIERLQFERARFDECLQLPSGPCSPRFEISTSGISPIETECLRISHDPEAGSGETPPRDEAAVCLLDALAKARVEETATDPVLVTFEIADSRPPPAPPPDDCLKREYIRKVALSHTDEIRECYLKAMGVWGEFGGRIEVLFVIAADGTSRQASVAGNTSPYSEFGCCVTSRMRRWRFPEPKGCDEVPGVYPFVFIPRQ